MYQCGGRHAVRRDENDRVCVRVRLCVCFFECLLASLFVFFLRLSCAYIAVDALEGGCLRNSCGGHGRCCDRHARACCERAVRAAFCRPTHGRLSRALATQRVPDGRSSCHVLWNSLFLPSGSWFLTVTPNLPAEFALFSDVNSKRRRCAAVSDQADTAQTVESMRSTVESTAAARCAWRGFESSLSRSGRSPHLILDPQFAHNRLLNTSSQAGKCVGCCGVLLGLFCPGSIRFRCDAGDSNQPIIQPTQFLS